jgi:hypothetical protein
MTRPLPDLWRAIAGKLRGHFNYFGVTDNSRALRQFDHAVHRLVFKWLNRRSQRHSFSWTQFCRYRARYPLPAPGRLVSLYPVGGNDGLKRLGREIRRQASVRGRGATRHGRIM